MAHRGGRKEPGEKRARIARYLGMASAWIVIMVTAIILAVLVIVVWH